MEWDDEHLKVSQWRLSSMQAEIDRLVGLGIDKADSMVVEAIAEIKCAASAEQYDPETAQKHFDEALRLVRLLQARQR